MLRAKGTPGDFIVRSEGWGEEFSIVLLHNTSVLRFPIIEDIGTHLFILLAAPALPCPSLMALVEYFQVRYPG